MTAGQVNELRPAVSQIARFGFTDANNLANGKSMDLNGDGKVDAVEYLFDNAGTITERIKDLIGRNNSAFLDAFVGLEELKVNTTMNGQELHAAAEKLFQPLRTSSESISADVFGMLGAEIDRNKDSQVDIDEFFSCLKRKSIDENGDYSEQKVKSFEKTIR